MSSPAAKVDLEILGLKPRWMLNALGMNWSSKEHGRCSLALVEATDDNLKELIAVTIGYRDSQQS